MNDPFQKIADLNKDTLPRSVRALFEVNNYAVHGPVQIHGAEVDLVATPKTDPFGTPIYIECTVEYVDVTKYGKDVTKLAMIANLEPNARKLIVSSKGFTLSVTERANQTGIQTITYADLFRKFEQFSPYVDLVLGNSDLSRDLASLAEIYQPPRFRDQHGDHVAPDYLYDWVNEIHPKHPWIVIVGEYGTGKTALTRILQRNLMQKHLQHPDSPIPFRLELRDFTRQFDSRGLIHHFMDANRLNHISIDFAESLLHRGRVILLLDGYDEMAQYMHSRERRTCLEALARLSSGGARGILTSRPNYFSEAEELQLFDALYRSISESLRYFPQKQSIGIIEKEREVDSLLESQFLERHERSLQDLSPAQTEELVRKSLQDDPVGQATVLAILKRVFRSDSEGSNTSLSGKPVIINYLLEVVEGLKSQDISDELLTEWRVYGLIVDQLMIRDFKRSQLIAPLQRRTFLEELSVRLSLQTHPLIGEDDFRELVGDLFANQLSRYSGVDRREEFDRIFADVRSSCTLTRVSEGGIDGWRMSHNSLREFFVVSRMVSDLESGIPSTHSAPITDAMRTFVLSLVPSDRASLCAQCRVLWSRREGRKPLGKYLSLLWNAVPEQTENKGRFDATSAALTELLGGTTSFEDAKIERLNFASDGDDAEIFRGASFESASLADVRFDGRVLTGARFTNAILDGVSFRDVDLSNCNFQNSALLDVNFCGANLENADFRGVVDTTLSLVVTLADGPARLEGNEARGFLRFVNAMTDDVAPYFVLMHAKRFAVVQKVLRKLSEPGRKQVRGLTQRGAAQQDPAFARRLLEFLISEGWVEDKLGREIVDLTTAGNAVCVRFLEKAEVDRNLADFLTREFSDEMHTGERAALSQDISRIGMNTSGSAPTAAKRAKLLRDLE